MSDTHKESKFKIGQKVRVRKDLNHAKVYNGVMPSMDMVDRSGQLVTISMFFRELSDNPDPNADRFKITYFIQEDTDQHNVTYCWTEDMFEEEEERTLTPQVSTQIRISGNNTISSELVYPLEKGYYIMVKLSKKWVSRELSMEYSLIGKTSIANKYAVPLRLNNGRTMFVYNHDGNYYLIDKEYKDAN